MAKSKITVCYSIRESGDFGPDPYFGYYQDLKAARLAFNGRTPTGFRRAELVEVTMKPIDPNPPKPKKQRNLTMSAKESRAHRKNIRRTIKALEKKIK